MHDSIGNTELHNGASAIANRLRLADGPIDLAWHHCSTTSEFLGEFFALRCKASGADYNEARHSIGYLVNELLENAVKFRAPGDIVIESSLEGARFELKVTNLVDAETAARFGALLVELTARDPGDLLIERIEANAADAGSSGSGLGLLTLMSDYGARLGWTFHRIAEAGPVRLTTFAALDIA
ncbi:ATP-binding protein [Mesorhizobium sp. L-8-10]|uniref:slr1658 superfamily regulator n=1 Tax=Mesorhizobium sp. L-8-10 TaxID=2744523 RepID=UPI0019276806|nr:ATP-binding protein [Mesorhizobium sp. L-8-10]BCH35575.1 ATP-binding protein [Mesorhizobium sp. L-8-10]